MFDDPGQKKRRELVVQSDPEKLSPWDQSLLERIRRDQQSFQQKFCRYCIHFDPKNNDFKEKKHPNNPEDCQWH